MAIALPCAADDGQEALELAKNRYDAAQFLDAHTRFVALLDPSHPACGSVQPGVPCRATDADVIERARTLDAAALIALKRDPEAEEQIVRILRANPSFKPSVASFPVEVIDRFTQVRAKYASELEALVQQKAKEDLARRAAADDVRAAQEKWIADLQKLAGEERVVKENSRWLALIPLGVGQYQNGDVGLGVAFTASETLLGAASLISIAVYNNYVQTFNDQRSHKSAGPKDQTTSSPDANALINTAVVVNRVTFGAWAALTVAGIVQAQIAFVPEKAAVRKRTVPPRPKVAPVATWVPGGAVLGLSGSF